MTTYYEQFAYQHFQKGEFGRVWNWIEMGLKTAPTDARLLALRERTQKYQMPPAY